jgi:hypothetical protein
MRVAFGAWRLMSGASRTGAPLSQIAMSALARGARNLGPQ